MPDYLGCKHDAKYLDGEETVYCVFCRAMAAEEGKDAMEHELGMLETVLRRQQREMAEMRKDRAGLQATVDKLPKTADGVPVMPGMAVWINSPCVRKYVVLGIKHNQELVELNCNLGSVLRSDKLYSTREAAEEARAAQVANP